MVCCLNFLLPACKYVLLAGDFNIDLLHASSQQEKYNNLLTDFQLVQHIHQRADESIIFYTYIVLPEHFSVYSVSQAIGVSDHRIQIVNFDIIVPQLTVPSCLVRLFRKCCWDDVYACLSYSPWFVLRVLDDIDDM